MSYSIKRVRNSEFINAIEEIRTNKIYFGNGSGGEHVFSLIPDGHKHISKLVVLRYHTQIVGWSVIVRDTDKKQYIWVYVLKSHRRQGFGLKLLDEAKKYFRNTLYYCSDITNYRFWKNVKDTRLKNSKFSLHIYDKVSRELPSN